MSTTHMLINPPSDVQAAVAAVIEACGRWQPTEVTLPPPSPLHIVSSVPPPGLNEAMVCGFIQHPDAMVWHAFSITVMTAVIIVAMIWTLRLHRLPAALWRMSLRLWRRAA